MWKGRFPGELNLRLGGQQTPAQHVPTHKRWHVDELPDFLEAGEACLTSITTPATCQV